MQDEGQKPWQEHGQEPMNPKRRLLMQEMLSEEWQLTDPGLILVES